MTAKQTIDTIAETHGITIHAAQGSYKHDTRVVRYVYAGTTLRVVYGHNGGDVEGIVDVKVLEFGVNGDRVGWGANGYWAPTWLSRPPTSYEGMSAARGQQIEGWYEAMYDAKPFATLGWAIEHLMQMVTRKQLDERRERNSRRPA